MLPRHRALPPRPPVHFPSLSTPLSSPPLLPPLFFFSLSLSHPSLSPLFLTTFAWSTPSWLCLDLTKHSALHLNVHILATNALGALGRRGSTALLSFFSPPRKPRTIDMTDTEAHTPRSEPALQSSTSSSFKSRAHKLLSPRSRKGTFSACSSRGGSKPGPLYALHAHKR